MKLLLIEDDKQTADFVERALVRDGHAVEVAGDGTRGLEQARAGLFDVIIVDRMLPGMDGLAIVKSLRNHGNLTPVLVLTALGSIDDRVDGLQAGGDDYLVKPFAFAELAARLAALARRAVAVDPTMKVTIADLEVDLVKRKVTRGGARIILTPVEFKVLEQLLRHRGRIVTKTMLLEEVWGFHFDPRTNIVETHVSRLRSKIDKGFDYELIETARGSGYMLRVPDAVS
ncbi:MAG: response regulator transcription factor [Hyphomicrobiaceae bacterium]